MSTANIRVGTLFALLITVWLGCSTSPGSQPRVLRVGTSGDYPPFSIAHWDAADGANPEPSGFDPSVARAYAHDRNLRIEWVRFRWPELLEALRADRFDVAMSGITVRPERSVIARTSVPVALSGALVLVRGHGRGTRLSELDRSGVRIAVNRGGHLERVARAHFRHASLLTFADNHAVRDALYAGRVDAVVSDSLEGPLWLAGHPEIVQIGPFTRDRKAYLTQARHSGLASDLDTWLLAREADGWLENLRREQLGPGGGSGVAEPLAALLAAVDERLALMPFVAEAKRREGRASLRIEVPEQEERVIEAALKHANSVAPLSPARRAALRAFFRAQIEAAVAIQRSVLAAPGDPKRAKLDLASDLRPALLRVGERITRLLPTLPSGLRREQVRAAARSALGAHGQGDAHALAIADALVEYVLIQ